MADTQSKVMSSSSPAFARAGSKRAVTCTYPKSGQEQSVALDQGEPYDKPGSAAVTFTAPKSGAKQSI